MKSESRSRSAPALLILGLVVGFGFGLWYAWVVSPVRYTNTSPDVLRADYRADYVLMVAEAYSGDHDLGLAAQRLSRLARGDMAGLVREVAAAYARAGYSTEDLRRLSDLAGDLARIPLPSAGGS